MTNYYLAKSGEPVITLYPGFGYQENVITKISRSRSQGGRLSTSKVAGGYYDINIPVYCVNSSDANIINGWHSKNNELYFSVDDGVFFGTIKVKIVNNESPFRKRIDSQFTMYDGEIKLYSIEDYYNPSENRLKKWDGTLFILDDPVNGILDSNILG